MPEQRKKLSAASWAEFMAEFHRHHSGITEEVLSRTLSGRQNPYRWLARAVSSRAGLVLDIGCGAGRMSRELAAPGRTVIGLDLSRSELQVAAARSAGPWVQADGTRLPFADASLDAVTTSMGLAVIEPASQLLGEVARVLKPGGVFASIAPTVRPLRPEDVILTARLTSLLRTPPRFPSSLEVTMGPLLAAAGLTRAEDRRERYTYQVMDRDDADRLITALYLPGAEPERRDLAINYLTSRASGGLVKVPIPIRRVLAVK